MISKPLWKYNCKVNRVLFILVLAVSSMYVAVVVSMYDKDFVQKMNTLMEMFPKQLMDAMGMSSMGGTLLSFAGQYLYGMLFLLLPLVYTIPVANRLVAKQVERGSMAYLLATGNSRKRIVRTQILFSIVGVGVMVLFLTVFLVVAAACKPGITIDYIGLLRLNTGLLLLHFAISAITFLASCICNETKYCLMLGAGISILFYVFQMLYNLHEQMDALKLFRYVTIYSLFDVNGLIDGSLGGIVKMLFLLVIGFLCYVTGYQVFVRKDLLL
ncbi:ABC transporter, permease protein [Lachnospiraceae bacterium KM106-2]|nr:ABC transporter, permease protein [Lachnospiraceae bacterium KM106-2]